MPLVNSVQIDSLKLVQDKQALSGAMPVAGFARLTQSLHDSSGNLAYCIQGAVDRQERPLLKLRVSGVVQLQCQRCLEGFEHAVTIETAVRAVAPDALEREYDDDPNEPDCVAASTAFDLVELIEDEVMLALPSYPRHEAGCCMGRAGTANEAAIGDASGTKISAFSGLRVLKQRVIQSKE